MDWIGTIVIPGRSAQPRVHWSSELWRLSNTRWIGLLSQADWRKHGCTVITLDNITTTLVRPHCCCTRITLTTTLSSTTQHLTLNTQHPELVIENLLLKSVTHVCGAGSADCFVRGWLAGGQCVICWPPPPLLLEVVSWEQNT